METALKAGERIDDLQRDGLRIIQREGGFRFGTDAVLLADFAAVRRGERVCDMGTGTAFCRCCSARGRRERHSTLSRCSGMWRIWRKGSVALNGLQARIRVHHADCREAGRIIGCETVQPRRDQPAVYGARRGLVSRRKPARFPIRIARLRIGWACARVLQNGGRLCAVFPAPRVFWRSATRCAGRRSSPSACASSFPDRRARPSWCSSRAKSAAGRAPLLPMLVTHTAGRRFHRGNAADLRGAITETTFGFPARRAWQNERRQREHERQKRTQKQIEQRQQKGDDR